MTEKEAKKLKRLAIAWDKVGNIDVLSTSWERGYIIASKACAKDLRNAIKRAKP